MPKQSSQLKALIALFPDHPTPFLEMLYERILQDPGAVTTIFNEAEESKPDHLKDSDPGWYATLITVNEILLSGDLVAFTVDQEEEPNYTTITIKTDYGS